MSPADRAAELLSRREAAHRAGVHTNTVLAWERNGLIKVKRVRVNGKVETRIPIAELDRLVREQRRSTRARRQEAEPQAEDRRISLRLRRFAAREEASSGGDDTRRERRDRQSAARAERREREAVAQAEAERTARLEAENRSLEAREELRAAKQAHAQDKRDYETAVDALLAETEQRAKALETEARRLQQADAEAKRQTKAAAQLRAEAEAHRGKIRDELAGEQDELRAARQELQQALDAIARERESLAAPMRQVEERERELDERRRSDEQRAAELAKVESDLERRQVEGVAAADGERAAREELQRRAREVVEGVRAEAASSLANATAEFERKVEAVEERAAARARELEEELRAEASAELAHREELLQAQARKMLDDRERELRNEAESRLEALDHSLRDKARQERESLESLRAEAVKQLEQREQALREFAEQARAGAEAIQAKAAARLAEREQALREQANRERDVAEREVRRQAAVSYERRERGLLEHAKQERVTLEQTLRAEAAAERAKLERGFAEQTQSEAERAAQEVRERALRQIQGREDALQEELRRERDARAEFDSKMQSALEAARAEIATREQVLLEQARREVETIEQTVRARLAEARQREEALRAQIAELQDRARPAPPAAPPELEQHDERVVRELESQRNALQEQVQSEREAREAAERRTEEVLRSFSADAKLRARRDEALREQQTRNPGAHAEHEVPVAMAPAPPKQRRSSSRRKRRLFGFVAIAVVSGLVVAGVLIAVKPFTPVRTATDAGLVRHSFAVLGFAVSVPSNWVERAATVGGAHGVAFSDSSQDPSRGGLRVLVQSASLGSAHKAIAAEIRKPPAGKSPIAVNDGLSVGGRRAFRYTFEYASAYYEQWWVERGGGTFRVEFTAPVTNQHEAGLLADRVVRTFAVL